MAIQPDGRIVAAGYASNAGVSPPNANNFVLARYNPDGSLDSTFGTNGVVIKDLGGNDQASSDVVMPTARSSREVLAGRATRGSSAVPSERDIGQAQATASGPMSRRWQ